MKPLVAAMALLLALPALQAIETTSLGDLTATLTNEPEKLVPGEATLTLTLSAGETAIGREPVTLHLLDNDRTLLAIDAATDENGVVTADYFFAGPGLYELVVTVRGEDARLPVRVHGQYVLLFGFLASSFIVLALLLGRI